MLEGHSKILEKRRWHQVETTPWEFRHLSGDGEARTAAGWLLGSDGAWGRWR